MRTAMILLGLICFLPVSAVSSPATLGGGFADAYTAFAPLYGFYRSYADHLFYGTEVEVPPGIEDTCQSFFSTLGDLQLELIIQTGSAAALTYVTHLRQSLVSFCSTYEGVLEMVEGTAKPDPKFLAQAADAGFFAAISNLNKLMENAFNNAIDSLPPGDPQWEFAAAFVCRTIIDQPRITHIDPTLGKVLLGSDETPPPPRWIPDRIMEAMHALSAYSGSDVPAAEVDTVRKLAEEIYSFLVGK